MLGEGSFERLLNWLRAGYPEGIPPSDYAAIFGVLSRRLTDEEIDRIAEEIVAKGDISADNESIRALVKEQVLETPTEDEVQRISETLAAENWPLSTFFPPGEAPPSPGSGD